ncbi:hypothetical protein CEXT_773081 [Caerostris extrusa]|uniref:Uncharacterized protein n=1 Tax=Caerostris extrusa TaxID=172846 RepID=A0AAV4QYR5_CAEEX|nr:hypothetical protein CEXT_773081 [Caerostris extrusa]
MFVQRIIYPSASSPNVGPTHCLLDYTWSKYSSDLLSTRPTTDENSCPTRCLPGHILSNALYTRQFLSKCWSNTLSTRLHLEQIFVRPLSTRPTTDENSCPTRCLPGHTLSNALYTRQFLV